MIQEAGEPLSRERRALQRDRLQIGEPHADDLVHQRVRAEPERGGGLVRRADRRVEITRASD